MVYNDAEYQGIEKRAEMAGKSTTFWVAMRPGKWRVLLYTPEGSLLDLEEMVKAHIRAKVEHPFRVIKQQFGFQKTRMREIDENHCKKQYSGSAQESVSHLHLCADDVISAGLV